MRNIPRQDCEKRDGYKKKEEENGIIVRNAYSGERENKIMKVESIRERSPLVDPPGGRSLLYRDVSDPLLFQ